MSVKTQFFCKLTSAFWKSMWWKLGAIFAIWTLLGMGVFISFILILCFSTGAMSALAQVPDICSEILEEDGIEWIQE